MVTQADIKLVRAILQDLLKSTSPTGTEADTRIRERIAELVKALDSFEIPQNQTTEAESPAWLRDLLAETRLQFRPKAVTKKGGN